jgi:hypothetical protein
MPSEIIENTPTYAIAKIRTEIPIPPWEWLTPQCKCYCERTIKITHSSEHSPIFQEELISEEFIKEIIGENIPKEDILE